MRGWVWPPHLFGSKIWGAPLGEVGLQHRGVRQGLSAKQLHDRKVTEFALFCISAPDGTKRSPQVPERRHPRLLKAGKGLERNVNKNACHLEPSRLLRKLCVFASF